MHHWSIFQIASSNICVQPTIISWTVVFSCLRGASLWIAHRYPKLAEEPITSALFRTDSCGRMHCQKTSQLRTDSMKMALSSKNIKTFTDKSLDKMGILIKTTLRSQFGKNFCWSMSLLGFELGIACLKDVRDRVTTCQHGIISKVTCPDGLTALYWEATVQNIHTNT